MTDTTGASSAATSPRGAADEGPPHAAADTESTKSKSRVVTMTLFSIAQQSPGKARGAA
jgi:hypothetical protein